jgi:hypothetical protein
MEDWRSEQRLRVERQPGGGGELGGPAGQQRDGHVLAAAATTGGTSPTGWAGSTPAPPRPKAAAKPEKVPAGADGPPQLLVGLSAHQSEVAAAILAGAPGASSGQWGGSGPAEAPVVHRGVQAADLGEVRAVAAAGESTVLAYRRMAEGPQGGALQALTKKRMLSHFTEALHECRPLHFLKCVKTGVVRAAGDYQIVSRTHGPPTSACRA